MIKLFYKPYLYFNLFDRHKIHNKRSSYSQFQEDLFINNFFKDKSNERMLEESIINKISFKC